MAWGKKSRHELGYDYAWVKVRKQVMERDEGECKRCKRGGRSSLAHAVDYIVSKAEAERRRWSRARTDHPSNLEAICKPCHDEKTEGEQGKKKRVSKCVVGSDSWPITNDRATS